MGWPKFVQNSWAATADGGLAVIAYAPTMVNAMAGGEQVQIAENTGYPFEEKIRLKISMKKPAAFPLALRIPGWCSNAVVRVNGKIQSGARAGSFFRVERKWKNGDAVEIHLPMPIQTLFGPSHAVAINRGPIVYSLKIGERWSVRTPDSLKMGFDEFEIHPTTPWNDALELNLTNPAASLTFTNFALPENPFDPKRPSVALLAKARQISGWTIGWRGTHAFEPPPSPVTSTNPLENVTLVPFGSQHLRVSWFPYLGTPSPVCDSFAENFDSSWCKRWTTFGGNWLARGGALRTVPASANGAKSLAMKTAFTNFTYEADVSVGASGDAGLIFRVSKPDIGADAYCGYYVSISSENSRLEFGWASNSWHEITGAPMNFTANQFYHLKIEARDSHFKIFVGDSNQPAIDVDDDHFSGGMIGVRDYCTDDKQSISGFAHLMVKELAAP